MMLLLTNLILFINKAFDLCPYLANFNTNKYKASTLPGNTHTLQYLRMHSLSLRHVQYINCLTLFIEHFINKNRINAL